MHDARGFARTIVPVLEDLVQFVQVFRRPGRGRMSSDRTSASLTECYGNRETILILLPLLVCELHPGPVANGRFAVRVAGIV
jgi:hypothetical protein